MAIAKALYQVIRMANDLSHSGGDSGARTRNLRLAKPALSQLSYIPWIVATARTLRCEAPER